MHQDIVDFGGAVFMTPEFFFVWLEARTARPNLFRAYTELAAKLVALLRMFQFVEGRWGNWESR